MSPLAIRMSKKADGTSAFAATRPDGSTTWKRYNHGFFPLHDLSHYAIETTLGLRHAFYGLLASGWNVTDFGEREFPDAARRDALLAEAMAGLFDLERATGHIPDPSGFNEQLRSVLEKMGAPAERLITPEELDTIRGRFVELAGRWARTPVGESLELVFEVEGQEGC